MFKPLSWCPICLGLIGGLAVGAIAPKSPPAARFAQLNTTEREQLRESLSQGQWREQMNLKATNAVLAEPQEAPFRSGLTDQERRALREQLRGVHTATMNNPRGEGESIAANELFREPSLD